MVVGIEPLNRFVDKSRLDNAPMAPSVDGSVPVSVFDARFSTLRRHVHGGKHRAQYRVYLMPVDGKIGGKHRKNTATARAKQTPRSRQRGNEGGEGERE